MKICVIRVICVLYVFFLFLTISQIIIAQQVTLLQPALRDSEMKLDSIYFYVNSILNEKLHFLTYDNEKNPTSLTIKQYDELGNIQDSFFETIEYHPINTYYTEHNLAPSWLPFKTITFFVLNTITNEFIVNFSDTSMTDDRFSFNEAGGALSYLEKSYDDNFNLDFEYREEVTLLNDLPIEKLFYDWNSSTNTSEINYKEIYYNTFIDTKLSERITTRIDDFITNTEVNSKKETFTITNTLLEYVLLNWNGNQ